MVEVRVETEQEFSILFERHVSSRCSIDGLPGNTGIIRSLALSVIFSAKHLYPLTYIEPQQIRSFMAATVGSLNYDVQPRTFALERLQKRATSEAGRTGKNYRVNPQYRINDTIFSPYPVLDLEFIMDSFYSNLANDLANAKVGISDPVELLSRVDYMMSCTVQPWFKRNSAIAAIMVMWCARILGVPVPPLVSNPIALRSKEQLYECYRTT